MTEAIPIPKKLLQGFGELWIALAGGRVEIIDTPAGPLYIWSGPDGRRESLPDRMYGLGDAQLSEIDPAWLPVGVPVNLPPGMSAPGAQSHCVTHQLTASSRDEAWSRLKRVGRQGVQKALRTGVNVVAANMEAFYGLTAMTAERLGGSAPHPDFVNRFKNVFGADSTRLVCVGAKDLVVSCVLAVAVEGYGMLVQGASNPAHWDKNPNNLAVWEAVGWLMDKGCERVDFGFSPTGSGDAQFKAHLGGQPIDLYRIVRAQG